jgi:MFS transporter, DHA2 family, lincomycin resistance protein
MGTLQQVAGAAGTALVVTVMASRMASLMGRGSSELVAQNAGLHTAFAILAVFAGAAIVLALFLRSPQPALVSADNLDIEHGSALQAEESDPKRHPHL